MGQLINVNFKSGKVKENKKFKDAGKQDFESIIRKNKENKEREKKDRAERNKRTTRNYRLR